MREWEIGTAENIHGALPYIRFAPILALVGVGVNRIGKARSTINAGNWMGYEGQPTVFEITMTRDVPDSAELAFWEATKDSGNAADYKAYTNGTNY